MRKLFPMLAVCGMILGFGLMAVAADDKKDEKTITGDATCAKCALKETKSCQNVVVVKDGDKKVNYYLKKNKVADDAHASAGFCKSEKKVKVTGVVTEKDGKMLLEASKIENVD